MKWPWYQVAMRKCDHMINGGAAIGHSSKWGETDELDLPVV